jgi:hypothetical protein
MDAINRNWQVLRALVLARPFILFVLTLFYVLAGFLTLTQEPGRKVSVILIMCAFPACGVFAIATQRVIQYTTAAGSLGLPRHRESMRIGQLWLVGIFVGIPASIAAACGGDPTYIMLLLVPAAIGVLLAIYSRWVFLLWVTLAVTTRFTYSFGAWMPGLGNAWLRTILVVLSVAALYWWLGLANRLAQRSLNASLVIADARHESSTASIGEALGADPKQYDLYEKAYDRGITAIVAGITDRSITKRVLQVGLAMPGRTNWRFVGVMVAISLAALLFLHVRNPHSDQPTGYLGITLLAAVSLFGQLNAVMQACKARTNEAALLVLTPRWPPQDKVKSLFLQIILERQSGTWAGWILVSIFASIFGLVGAEELFTSTVVMIATGSCATGALLLALSRKVFKEVSLLTIATLLCGVAGTVAFLFGAYGKAQGQMLGLGLVLVPLAVGALSFSIRPVQFPVRMVNKQ